MQYLFFVKVEYIEFIENEIEIVTVEIGLAI